MDERPSQERSSPPSTPRERLALERERNRRRMVATVERLKDRLSGEAGDPFPDRPRPVRRARRWVRDHPLLSLSAAAAGGFLLVPRGRVRRALGRARAALRPHLTAAKLAAYLRIAASVAHRALPRDPPESTRERGSGVPHNGGAPSGTP